MSDRPRKVLLVEDDDSLAVALSDAFRSEGYDVELAADGEAGLEQATSERADLVILDLMLPKRNGLDVCQALRSRGIACPIIMLTARSTEVDRVLGLRLGADDYVTKPFSLLELLARAEAVLRRTAERPASVPESVRIGEVEVDFQRLEAYRGERPVKLSPREFRLLEYLVGRGGGVATREELLQEVWGYSSLPFTRTVDTHVAKLRKKIEPLPSEPRHLITVHRIGYKLVL